MGIIGYLFKVLLFFLYALLLYSYCCIKERIRIKNGIRFIGIPNYDRKPVRKNVKYSLGIIIIFSILLGFLSLYLGAYPYQQDRYSYAIKFVPGNTYYWPAAFQYVANVLLTFTNNPEVLFFAIAFISTFGNLIAFNLYEERTSSAAGLFGISLCLVYSFYALKQAPAIALVSVSIALLLKRKYIVSFLLAMLATLFHESAFAVIPLYCVVIGAKKRWVRCLEYSFVLLTVVFFQPVTQIISFVFGSVAPDVFMEAERYFSQDGAINISLNLLTAIKGLPYYLITVYAIRYRNILKPLIENYDKYLTISVFSSAMTILSTYMYWMWRFAAYGYFTMLIFWGMIIKVDKSNRRININYLLILSMAFFTARYIFLVLLRNGGF